jgi:hypothetical protein
MVFQPIYDVACRKDFAASAKLLGLILWHVMLWRDEVWGFDRYKKGSLLLEEVTYFKIAAP